MSIARAHLEKAVKRLGVAEKLFRDGEYEDVVSRAYYARIMRLELRYPLWTFSLRPVKGRFQSLAENSY
jgi:hypothetical protein